MKEELENEGYLTRMYIPKEKVMEYNDLMRNEYNDLKKLGIAKFSVVELFTAEFPNGYEARLYINSHDFESGGISAEMVLFDTEGKEVCCETAYDKLDNPWCLYDEGDEFINCNKYTIMIISD
jgi:hypothetical protein